MTVSEDVNSHMKLVFTHIQSQGAKQEWINVPRQLRFFCDSGTIKGTTKQKMARRHSKEGGNHLEHGSNRRGTMEGIDGGLHPAADGQSLGER